MNCLSYVNKGEGTDKLLKIIVFGRSLVEKDDKRRNSPRQAITDLNNFPKKDQNSLAREC